MNRKVGPDAFNFYIGLGPGRSYREVADHYHVTKQAITKVAAREDWQKRLEAIEMEARERSDAKAVDTLETMNERHLQTLQVIQRKALEALRSMPLATAMEAVRALDMSIGKERLIRGEPSDRSELSIQEITKREMERWLTRDDGPGQDRPVS